MRSTTYDLVLGTILAGAMLCAGCRSLTVNVYCLNGSLLSTRSPAALVASGKTTNVTVKTSNIVSGGGANSNSATIPIPIPLGVSQ
jgi:hypothetical protein